MTSTPLTSREVRLASRPHGEPTPDNFELVEAAVKEPAPGQVLVRNTWMSVEPYMRGRMDGVESYIEPFQLHLALEGTAVGEVTQSADPSVAVGAYVTHFQGWRDYAAVDAAEVTPIDVDGTPPQAYLGPLGTPGLTAYVALTDTAPVADGDVVFVSSAAGAVGGVAGQIARKLGASRVIGSVGGAAKATRIVDELRYDAAIDYRAGPLPPQLTAAAPEGIDVYVDLVGSDHLEAAVGAMRLGGRVALVGSIGEYNATELPPGPRNLYQAVKKRLTLRGMLVLDHLDKFPDYLDRARGWIRDGSLRTDETVVDGLDRAPHALIDLLRGASFGKMLVRIA